MVQRAELVAQREAVIARLAETGERDAHARLYEAEYLPLAMALMADEAEATDVLLLTVGTQPYSVALSLVRSPARVLYLVFTDQTHAVAQKALELVDLAFEAVFWRRVPAADSAAVYRVLREAHDAHPGQRVVVNFTSGTKAMTAGASTVAGYLNLEQLYIASVRLPGALTAFGREEVHRVDHPLVVFGDIERAEAERAFDGGRFGVAERLFNKLGQAMVPGCHWPARASLARGYSAWEALDFKAAADELTQAVVLLDGASRRALPEERLFFERDRLAEQSAAAQTLLEATGAKARTVFDAAQTNALVRALVARARRAAPRAPDLSALLAYRVLELSIQRRLAVQGLDAGAPTYPEADALLSRYNAGVEARYQAKELPSKISLLQGRWVLRALGDGVVDEAERSDRKFVHLLMSRNQNIYTHGFKTIRGEGEFEKFSAMALAVAGAVAAADGLALPAGEDRQYDFVRLAS
ncbi:MAG: TIGR02710 family CRISPR-associated protein [Myxococcales bacterium]|nr:TIGR02710 family CRISPR-associated protein [Myxococcales bacterium]